MLPVYYSPIFEFGISSSGFTNLFFFTFWTNEYVMRFLLSHVILIFRKNCLPMFLNVYEIRSKSCWQHRHLLFEHLNTSAVLSVNKEFLIILFRFGGCRFAWINLISLKPLTLFSTSVFTPDFTKSNIFGLFELKVLMKVKLLLFPIVLCWHSLLWGSFLLFLFQFQQLF